MRAQHYDLVVNGMELGGGSIRIHDARLQKHIFDHVLKVSLFIFVLLIQWLVVQLSPPEAKSFSHLVEALSLGCPPHGGIALGASQTLAMLIESEYDFRFGPVDGFAMQN